MRRNVMRLLFDNDLSITDCAKKTGIPRSTIYSVTSGRVETSVSNALKIAKAFGITVDELLKGAE